MSAIQMPMLASPTLPSALTSSPSPSARRTLRERCGFTLQLSTRPPPPPRTLRDRCGFALRLTLSPAFPTITAKRAIGPTRTEYFTFL
ncbi:hypothetical protein DFH09DRAFT_1310060 [Mycena vulgaris]|nr:hypothetical protein DFH09DRAFT_1310060 [Mycena vulgaris]